MIAPTPASSARRTCASCRNGGEWTVTRSGRSRAIPARRPWASRADTTCTTAQPGVAVNTGATTRAPKPVPTTSTLSVMSVALGGSFPQYLRFRRHGHVEAIQCDMRNWRAREREHHRADAERAAEEPADD